MNIIYKKFYAQKLFSIREAGKIIKNRQVCKNTLHRLESKGYIKRIKRGIYYILPIDNKEFYPNKNHIAAYQREDYTIAGNSALSIYKLRPETAEPIIILSKNPAKIKIKDLIIKIKKNKHNLGITSIKYNTGYSEIELNITDIERTIIDCIQARSIRLEDFIPIIKSSKLDAGRLLNYLDKYKKPILYNKTGILLDSAREFLNIRDDEIEKLSKKLSKKIYYAKERGLTLMRPKYRYYQRWNIMLPEPLYNILQTKKS
jgi:predicted transcriptional regulator of viral defense system